MTAPCGCTYAISTGIEADWQEDIAQGATLDRVDPVEGAGRLIADCPHDPKWGGLD